jgi:murein DD-endopeptidase MepM/ murein hydrolase activator NlpD
MLLRSHSFGLIVFFACLTVLGCKREIIADYFEPRNDHEAYLHSLDQVNLLSTALGRDWLDAATFSLEQPIQIAVPYLEAFYFDPTAPLANGYIFSVKRGQKVEISVIGQNADYTKLFMDLFLFDSMQEQTLDHVATSATGSQLIGFEPRMDGDYLLRLQPELLRGGRFTLSIKVVAALSFPVQEGKNYDIGGLFGDPRDGGRRKHHGIDIFAKRFTPILAPTDGRIRFAGERGLGGQVVWMRDQERDLTLYFAHLQTIVVTDGMQVQRGDTLGTVGNTGNAQATAPHLHFGIYQDGPIDPYYFVAHTKIGPNSIKVDDSLVGEKVRMSKAGIFSSLEGQTCGQNLLLEKYQLLEIQAATTHQYRVRLPDGMVGLIEPGVLEQISQPLAETKSLGQIQLLDRPDTDSSVIGEIGYQVSIGILAKNQDHWYVDLASGRRGWMISSDL